MTRTLTLVRNSDVATQADENVRLVVEMLLAARRLHRDALVPVLGVARSTVYAKLGGKQRFTVGEVALLAEFFEIEPGAFMAGPTALITRAGVRPKSVPGSIKYRGTATPGSQPTRPTGRLSLVAA